MIRKVLVLLAVAVCTAGTSQVRAQFGFTPIKRPNIANIFHPVVGAGTVYEQTDRDGTKSLMELSVVGSEMVGTQQGYWMEFGHNNKRGNGDLTYGKALITSDDFVAHKVIFMMPGSSQPMEMELNPAQGQRSVVEKNMEKWHTVGTESITVPAGTFSCEHWTKDAGKGDVWVSSKISPMGMVKSVDTDQTLVLTKVISDAKSHITGTPMKFDPKMMMQQRMGKQP
jgi:hypothetical protein